MDSWFQLTLQMMTPESEQISGLLFELGCSGVEFDDSDPTSVFLKAYFPGDVGQDEVVAAVRTAISASSRLLEVDGVPHEDWATKWREHFEPVYPTSRMIIHPPWSEIEAPSGGYSVVIEPKTAFGTGSHPTTKMALLALEKVVQEGDRLLYVGTGSGILSIAGVKLGASSALAIDTDPLATDNVKEYVTLNGVEGVRAETRTLESTDTGYDVVVANILRSVLTPLLPTLHAAAVSRGKVILGGLLDREANGFCSAVEGAGLRILEVTREAEWIGLITESAG
ncbi:50S ribosomal protein L11 methyltransferase [bacterium]|nr:50S ribosomal protein L11 methyltransferase [bacterium]